MPYVNELIKIQLCETCAGEYKGKKNKAKVVISKYARGCLGHYVDLDTIKCIERVARSKNGTTQKER
jgi:hypothetical protein